MITKFPTPATKSGDSTTTIFVLTALTVGIYLGYKYWYVPKFINKKQDGNKS